MNLVMALLLSGAFQFEEDTDGSEEDVNVQHDGKVANVVKVVLELDERILDAVAVVVMNLGPTGDARLDGEAGTVEADFFFQGFDEFRALRAGAAQTHVV